MKKLLLNLPLIAAILITVGFSVDLPFLRSIKTEENFGLAVVVLIPAALLLSIAQVALWVALPASRPMSRETR